MEEKSFEELGTMEMGGGQVGWLAAGKVERLAGENRTRGPQSRLRRMFLEFLRGQVQGLETTPGCKVCSNSVRGRRSFYTGINAGRLRQWCAEEKVVYMGYYDVWENPDEPRLLYWTAVPARELLDGAYTKEDRDRGRYLITVPEREMETSRGWRAVGSGRT